MYGLKQKHRQIQKSREPGGDSDPSHLHGTLGHSWQQCVTTRASSGTVEAGSSDARRYTAARIISQTNT